MKLEYESTLSKANVKGKSLRTNVPREILKLWKLEAGDKLTWEVEINGEELIINVKPKKRENK